VLTIRRVTKSFGGVRALDGVDFDLAAGEVRALLGSNGAGKSTLMKVVCGAVKADSGQVLLDDYPVSFSSTSEAARAGVASVYQELSLIPALSVAENVMLGRWRRSRKLGISVIDRAATRLDAYHALEFVGERIELDTQVDRLSVGQQQLVEIAKALSTRPKLLILDEPTSALSKRDADAVIALVRRLAEQGLAIVYVSHRMDEIPRVADTLTVMRDGRVVDTVPVSEAPTERVAMMMVGRTVTDDPHEHALEDPTEEVRLSVKNLSWSDRFTDVSFEIRRGEVFGIAGLIGSGRSELLHCLFGRVHADNGTIKVDGRIISAQTERRMIAAGIGLVPEDRKRQGLVLPLTVGTNLVMAAYPRFVRSGVVSTRRERAIANEAVDQLDIKATGLRATVSTLSGGNQQKVVIGKWLAAEADILLLDEPTRGVDIHTKAQIYALVRELARDGCSILIVSSEMEELFEVCHRIAILNRGRLVATLPINETDIHRVLMLAMAEA
jgi:ABC-type sugar transport system ATPase subunit